MIFVLFMQASQDVGNKIRDTTALSAVEKISSLANEVYRLGPGTKLHVWVDIPPNVQASLVSGNEVGLKIYIPDAYDYPMPYMAI